MPLESGERRPTRLQNTVGPEPHPPPPPPPPKPEEQLACPRCQSTNTKFCYYNNYNLSQPRHFCKSCRRYWTQGGTLRNVPVGGGTRKNSKRSRSSHVSSSSSSSSSTTASTSALSTLSHESESLPVSLPAGNSDSAPLANIKADPVYDDLNLNENLPVTEDGNFLSLMNSHPEQGAAGSMGLGISGYGPGFGFGLCEPVLGFGGRGVWPYPGMNYNASVGNGGAFGSGNTWQPLDDVDGGELVDGDCFAWPGLAISNPGRSLK